MTSNNLTNRMNIGVLTDPGSNSSAYIWKIHSFFNQYYHTADGLKEPGQSIESPVFSSGDKGSSKWRLILYPFGMDKKDDNFMSIQLRTENGFQGRV